MSTRQWNVLIADDEPAARRGVRQLLAPFPSFAVISECRNGAEVLAALSTGRVADVIFLDVQMPGVDGFGVIEHRCKTSMPAVVFLTAYDQFAVRAFEAEAIDYLLKPVSEVRFAATIDRLTRYLTSVANAESGPSIALTTERGVRFVSIVDIEWIEAAGNYSQVWVDGRSYLIRRSLHELEQLVKLHGFVRAHRRALVPVKRVRELMVTSDDRFFAVLEGGTRIPISRRRRALFRRSVRSRG
jgi:two-component system LytT family response regulator